MRAGAKHLCGQACVHKLADDFMVRIIAPRAQSAAIAEQAPALPVTTDTSLTTQPDDSAFESSARLIPTPPQAIAGAATAPRLAAALIPMPERLPAEISSTPPQESPHCPSRSRRADAWERERERMMQASGHHPEVLPRRISKA